MTDPRTDAALPDPGWLDGVLAELGRPQEIEAVELLESQVKEAWRPAVHRGLDPAERLAFVRFFHRLGPLHKYKSYATKYASPFGYSLFDQVDGQGFSVQLHVTDKIEAFHVLQPKSEAFVLISSEAEWHEHAEAMLAGWADGDPDGTPLTFRPEPGDIVGVDDLSTVHTVVGCIVEEWATSSYDVVVRLHDQNEGRELVLPAAHRPLGDVLGSIDPPRPTRRMVRDPDWEAHDVAADPVITIVALPDLGLSGESVAVGHRVERVVGDDQITTVVGLAGTATVTIDGTAEIVAAPGEMVSLPPGTAWSLEVAGGPTARASTCTVGLATAFADLR